MSSLYKLITKTNLKSPAIAFPLVMPLIFILLYSVGIKEGLSQEELSAVVATFLVTILSIQTMQSGLMGFGINFMSIKDSVLLRRIGATKLNKFHVISAVLLYGLTMWAITLVWIFILMIGFNATGVFYSIGNNGEHIINRSLDFFSNINWARLLLALTIMLIASYSLGLFFTSISQNPVMYQAIAMLYFFVVAFMGGMIIPGPQPTWMTYTGYIIPHAYISDLFNWSAETAQIVNHGWSTWVRPDNGGEWVLEISKAKFTIDIVMPLAFSALCLYGSVKLLKFD